MSTKRPTPPPADCKFDPKRSTSPPPPPKTSGNRCEIFERVFCSAGMSGDECLRKCESILPELKNDAAEFAGHLLKTRGYFNGRIESGVYCLSTNDTKVSVVLTCYGLPQFNEPKKEVPMSPESSPIQIRWTDEHLAFIKEAQGKKGFAEFVRSAALKEASRILKRKPPEVRGRGRPKKSDESPIDNR